MRIHLALTLALCAGSVTAQTMMPIPPYNNTYSSTSQVRGLYFQAPVDFFITGLRVPDEQNSGLQHVEVIRSTTTLTGTQTTGTNQVFFANNVPSSQIIATNIFVQTGEWVGILACCGTTTQYNSYSASLTNYMSDIFGNPVAINRFGSNTNLITGTGSTSTYGQTGNIGRCEVYVQPPSGLYAGFSATPTSGASPLTVNFTDTSFSSDPGGVLTWDWDLDGDGASDSTLQNPSFTYNLCGQYSVTLSVTDASNPMSTLTKTDYIDVDPQFRVTADFTATPTSGASPLTVQFTDTSTGTPTMWAWDFDNNGTIDDTTQNPTYTYAVGCTTYDVSLTVSNACYSDTMTKTGFVVVDPPIVADFSATPQFGLVPLTVNFSDQSIGTPTAWAWDLDGDGLTDSTLQNPSFTYNTAGAYDVSLTATDICSSNTATKLGFIQVGSPGGNNLTPDLMCYQFNEIRGATINNVATGAGAPATALGSNSAWQADPGHAGFGTNEAGFGCAGYGSGIGFDTGWPVNVSGDITIMWWARRDPASTGTNPFGYAFSNGTFRAFFAGAGGTGVLFRGSPLGDFQLPVDVINNNSWQHFAIVVDDTAGVATWYHNGFPATTKNFTPGTFTYSGGNMALCASSTSGSSSITTHWDMDDFRFYTSAVSFSDILACTQAENASNSFFDDPCPSPAGAPAISATGVPTIPNPAYQMDLSNLELASPASLWLGIEANLGGLLPVPVFIGQVCNVNLNPMIQLGFNTGGGSISIPSPIPNDLSLAGGHIYVQGLILGSVLSATGTMDLNFQL